MKHIDSCIIAVTLLLTALSAARAEPSNGLTNAQVISILRHQGFESSTDAGTTLTYIGKIPEKSGTFSIYYYDHVNSVTLHGIQELLIIKNDKTYVGSYGLNGDEGLPSISDTDVLFKVPEALGNKIHFDANGPPLSAGINGGFSPLDPPSNMSVRIYYIDFHAETYSAITTENIERYYSRFGQVNEDNYDLKAMLDNIAKARASDCIFSKDRVRLKIVTPTSTVDVDADGCISGFAMTKELNVREFKVVSTVAGITTIQRATPVPK